MKLISCTAYLGFLLSSVGWAQTPSSVKPANISLVSFRLQPRMIASEGQEFNFGLQNSWVGTDLELQDQTRAVIGFGQTRLLRVPSRYGSTNASEFDFGLVNAFGEFKGSFATVRLGLQTVPLSLENFSYNRNRHLGRSLIYQARIASGKDVGLSIHAKHKNYYSILMVHNGEGESELDNRVWLTGSWGYRNGPIFHIGGTLSTGETTPTSTAQASNPSTDTLFDINENAKWRMGAIYMQMTFGHFAVDIEAFLGSVEQDLNGSNDFYSGRLDAYYQVNRNIELALRYGYLDRDRKRAGDQNSQLMTGVSLHNESQTSKVILEGRLNFDNSVAFENQVRLVWRISDSAPLRFMN